MGQMKRNLLYVTLLVWCLLNGVGTSTHCSGAFFTLTDCLDFVLEGSMVYPRLGGACCIELGSIVKQSTTCLCEAAAETARLGIRINVSRALALLSVCKIVSTPITHCDIVPLAPWHVSTSPKPATTPTPSPAPNFAPEEAPTFPLDPTPGPLPLPTRPAPPPNLPDFLSMHSGSPEVPTDLNRCVLYFMLICTNLLLYKTT